MRVLTPPMHLHIGFLNGVVYLFRWLIKFMNVDIARKVRARRFLAYGGLFNVLYIGIDITAVWQSASHRLSRTKNVTCALDLLVSGILR